VKSPVVDKAPVVVTPAPVVVKSPVAVSTPPVAPVVEKAPEVVDLVPVVSTPPVVVSTPPVAPVVVSKVEEEDDDDDDIPIAKAGVKAKVESKTCCYVMVKGARKGQLCGETVQKKYLDVGMCTIHAKKA
jgi:hypothetical protein